MPVATGSGYTVPNLDFYLKSEEGYEWFDELPKGCIEWKIRDLCKKTDKEPDK